MGYSYTNSNGIKYYLNKKQVTLRGGQVQMIIYFSKDRRPETEAELPEGYEVVEASRNGFVVARRIKK